MAETLAVVCIAYRLGCLSYNSADQVGIPDCAYACCLVGSPPFARCVISNILLS